MHGLKLQGLDTLRGQRISYIDICTVESLGLFFIGTEITLVEMQIILKGHKQDSMTRHSLLNYK